MDFGFQIIELGAYKPTLERLPNGIKPICFLNTVENPRYEVPNRAQSGISIIIVGHIISLVNGK